LPVISGIPTYNITDNIHKKHTEWGVNPTIQLCNSILTPVISGLVLDKRKKYIIRVTGQLTIKPDKPFKMT